MGYEIIKGVFFHPIKLIGTTGGKVMHAIKGFDDNFAQFGECYFSTCESKSAKAWKKHSKMTCNLFIPVGSAKFVFYDDRHESVDFGRIAEIEISQENYGRLIIQPGIWFGFAGTQINGDTLILNISSIAHDPEESLRLEPNDSAIPYSWRFD